MSGSIESRQKVETLHPGRTAMRERSKLPEAGLTHSYAELTKLVRTEGLMARRHGWYWTRIATAVLAFLTLVVVVVVLGDTWWQLAAATGFGLLTTQFGFLGHDAAHRQIFASGPWNDWTARVLAGGFAGLSYGWWRGKHSRHHARPNQADHDPDIAPGLLAFTREIAGSRTAGLAGWFTRHQGWLFFPLLTLEGLNLHAAGLRHLSSPGPVKHRSTELTLVTFRLTANVVVLFLVMSPAKSLAFLTVQLAVFGIGLGGSFAPNHKGMPIVPATMRVDFLRRQVLMSRNVRGGPFTDLMMGGLNYQIEHHLFPSMARPQLKRAQVIVRAYCNQHDVAYSEVGLFESYGIVVDYLNHVGLRARDPFQCPLAVSLRG
jgi:fatty acid desaturase